MSIIAENLSTYLDTITTPSGHSWNGNAVPWKTISSALEPLLAHASVDDIVAMKPLSQAGLLNLLFSHDTFEPLLNVVSPLWTDSKYIRHLMRCITSIGGVEREPITIDFLPFVFQDKALETPEILSALKVYPDAFAWLFTLENTPQVSSTVVEAWLDRGLCSFEQVVHWAAIYDQQSKISHLKIPQEDWAQVFSKYNDPYFLSKTFEIAPPSKESAWTIVSNHLPSYDRYEGGFGEWESGFVISLLRDISWDAEKIHALFELTVGFYNRDLEIGDGFEYLHSCLPAQGQTLLEPYLLMFDFTRSQKMQDLTTELEQLQQRDTLNNAIAVSPSLRSARKI